jgi:hypothetical protein
MVQITSPAPYTVSRPQDVIDIINKNSAVHASAGVIFIALGGILIDAYQAAMVGFGNKYIAAQFGISPGLAATVNAGRPGVYRGRRPYPRHGAYCAERGG